MTGAEPEPFGPRVFFDFFLHEAENIHNRVDWSLISHGILFEAFVTAKRPEHRITLGVLGFLVGWVWLISGIRQLSNLRYLVGEIQKADVMGPEAANLLSKMYIVRSSQTTQMKRALATPAFCVLLPSVVTIAWLIATATYQDTGVSWVAVAIAILACALLTLVWFYFPKPKNPTQKVR